MSPEIISKIDLRAFPLSHYMYRDIIPFFQGWEMACRCGCGLIILQPKLLLLEYITRTEFCEPVDVHSWNRCLTHNRAVGSKDNSFHRFGKAIDKSPSRGPITPRFIEINQRYYPCVIIYDTFLHCDIRGKRSISPN